MTTAHGVETAAWLLVLVPAVSSAVLLCTGRWADRWAQIVGALVPVALFVYAVILFFAVKSESNREVSLHLFSWISVGSFQVDAGMLIDPLALVFVLLITGVGSLIHIYAVGYMAHDPGRRRFFGYFNGFIAAMLLLVLADNYLVLYVGWEGVGLASYLLIGYYYNRPTAATAAKKAFIANRVGDAGLSIGIMLMFAYLGTTSFAGVFGQMNGVSRGVATAIALMLLLGACGKSGQVPLQTWLPDAMEGPTPVSALIHAATMVTAGVYLIARSSPIFNQSQAARTVVVIIGAVTLLYGCICAFGQDDLKRVLAYSTVSQIGYMFLAVGLGPGVYAIGIIHLLGHGFFKAALFLSAGSVMHAMNDRIDMRRLGGLSRVMPITYLVFVAGFLAIIGFPLATGFWTKDKIIEAALDKGGTSGWILGMAALLGAGLTAFYMTRALVMTFHGERRWEPDVHPHESPPIMTWPMILLGVLSLVGGYLLIFGGGVQHWLTPSVGPSIEEGVHTVSTPVLTALTLVVVALGVVGAWLAFGLRPVPASQPVGVSPVTTAARKNIYADAFNESVLMRPGQWMTRALVFFDNRGVDGAVNGLAAGFGGGSARVRRSQTGFVRSYALSMLGGSVAVLAVLLAIEIRMSHNVALPILVLIPLIGSLVVFAQPRTNALAAKRLSLLFSLVPVVYLIVLGARFDTASGAPRFQFTGSWTWIKALGVHLAFGVDGIALVLTAMAVILVPTVILASWNSFDTVSDAEDLTPRTRPARNFFALVLLLEFFMIGVFTATDVFLFYVFFEAMLVPMYFIIGSFGEPRRQYAAMKFFLYSLVGGLLMLAAVIGVYVTSGSRSFAITDLIGHIPSGATQKWLFLGFFIAFAIKAPLVPFHTWLPDSGAEAPVGGAALLVGVLDKVGTFGFLRYCLPLFPEASRYFAPTVLILSVIGILYAAFLAIGQRDMKRLVAYTSIAHFGFIGLGIFAFTTQGGAVFYMVNHGFSTGALFLIVGMLIAQGKSRLINDYGGAAKVTPLLSGVLLLAGLSALALPGLSTFVSEFLVLVGTFTRHKGLAVLATAGIILAALYVLILYQRTMQGEINPKVRRFRDLNVREAFAVAPLLALIVFLGVYPKPVLDVVNPAIKYTLQDVGKTDPVAPGAIQTVNGGAK